MPTLTLDVALFGTFLALNLIIGLCAGRHVKTLREYAIGRKEFSTATITSTIIATWIGGGFLFYALKNIYTTGLHFIIPLLGGLVNVLLIAVLAVRMGEFLNNLSVAEAMGDLYGRVVRIITALSGIAREIGGIAIQFQVIGKMLTFILGFQGPEVTVVAAAIVIGYSAFGGIRSVTITDVFQFITFIIFIPILALIVWNNLKIPGQVAHTLATNPIFSFREIVGWNPQFISSLGLLLIFAMPALSPPIFQRVAIARNVQQAKNAFTYASGGVFLTIIVVAWIAILLLADNPHLEASKLVDYIINRYAYPGLKGLIALGITAMAMSTADSCLNASAVLAVHDIIRPLKPSFKESITIVRLFSLCVGAFALLLALRTTDLLELMLLSGSFYMPIVTVPLLLAIFGFRSSTKAVLIGIVAGFMTVVLWSIFWDNADSIIPGMLANLLFLIGSHYLLQEEGGWVGIKDKAPLLAARQARKDAWEDLIEAIKHPKPYAYLKKNLPAKAYLYSLFGLYIIGATYTSFFTIPEAVVTTYQKLYDHIAHSVLIAAAAFITYPAWPPTFRGKRFIAFFWPLGIFYILFLVGSVLVVMSGFHQVQVMIFMLNLVMAALLLDWSLMLTLAISGVLLAWGVFRLYVGSVPLVGVADSLQFRTIYGLPLFIGLLVALVRLRQINHKLTAQNAHLHTTHAKTRSQVAEAMVYREEFLKELAQDEAKLFSGAAAAYVKQAVYRLIGYIRLEVSEVRLDQLIRQAKALLKLQQLESRPQIIVDKRIAQETVRLDPAQIGQLLVDSIVYVQEHNPTNQPITIGLERATLGHKLDHIPDYIRRVAALKLTITTAKHLPPTQDIYMISPMPAGSPDSPGVIDSALAENVHIIDAHYGYADVSQPTTHVYVIPLNVREVRGKVMELLRAPAAADPEEAKHPLAIQLEQELLAKLQGTKVDLQVIHQALATIKKYHGGVRRKSGEPFFTHPLAVALILTAYSQDQDAVVAALLHDTVEDTGFSMAQVRARFGDTVAYLVEKSTNLEDKIRRVSLQDHEYKHRLINYEDSRAALIKLSDRLHNMRTIQGHPSLTKQKKIADETLTLFVPLAQKLGLSAMAEELEQLSLEVLKQ